MNYAEISKETISLLTQSRASLKSSPLPAPIRTLAELRTSQINGCAYCCHLHTEEARKEGISQAKLDELPGWHSSSLFSSEERLALEWVEAVTHLDGNLEELKAQLLKTFSERQIVDLTACIGIMNAFNRIVLSLH